MSQLFLSIELHLARKQCHRVVNWLQMHARLPSPWHPRSCRHVFVDDSEPISLNPCRCADALAGACQKHSCHHASHIFQTVITNGQLVASQTKHRTLVARLSSRWNLLSQLLQVWKAYSCRNLAQVLLDTGMARWLYTTQRHAHALPAVDFAKPIRARTSVVTRRPDDLRKFTCAAQMCMRC